MLIEFSVSNFRSFRETQTLKMTATNKAELLEENSFSTNIPGLPRLLRSAVVYGPNAAGKSNLINAMAFMKNFIISSARESQEGEPINVKPFLFVKQGHTKPCEFEVIFTQDGVRYQYGFAADVKRVTHEWLFAYPEGRAQRWFERVFDTDSQTEKWYFGSKFTGRKKLIKEATRKNALFLSTAIQLNNDQLKPVYNWFQKLSVLHHSVMLSKGYTAQQCEEEETKQRILDFMNAADLSIAGISLDRKQFSAEELPKNMPQEFKDVIKKEFVDKEIVWIRFLHSLADKSGMVSLDLEEESDGTQKMFAYAGPLLDVLTNGRILFVDELDNSLHPMMVRFLLGLFHNPQINKNNGQLVFSTHDTTHLDQSVFRRDQIWFIEKDKNNASQLYPLTDFSPRKGEALERGYLQGRYGALPYLGEFRF